MVCSSYRSGSMLLLSLSLRPKATSIGTTVMCWQIFISRDNLLQVRASAPWLSAFVGSPPVRSSPRVLARGSAVLVPRVVLVPRAAASSWRALARFSKVWKFNKSRNEKYRGKHQDWWFG